MKWAGAVGIQDEAGLGRVHRLEDVRAGMPLPIGVVETGTAAPHPGRPTSAKVIAIGP